MVTEQTKDGMVSRLQFRDYLALVGVMMALGSPLVGWVWKTSSRVQRIEDTRYSADDAARDVARDSAQDERIRLMEISLARIEATLVQIQLGVNDIRETRRGG